MPFSFQEPPMITDGLHNPFSHGLIFLFTPTSVHFFDLYFFSGLHKYWCFWYPQPLPSSFCITLLTLGQPAFPGERGLPTLLNLVSEIDHTCCSHHRSHHRPAAPPVCITTTWSSLTPLLPMDPFPALQQLLFCLSLSMPTPKAPYLHCPSFVQSSVITNADSFVVS